MDYRSLPLGKTTAIVAMRLVRTFAKLISILLGGHFVQPAPYSHPSAWHGACDGSAGSPGAMWDPSKEDVYGPSEACAGFEIDARGQ